MSGGLDISIVPLGVVLAAEDLHTRAEAITTTSTRALDAGFAGAPPDVAAHARGICQQVASQCGLSVTQIAKDASTLKERARLAVLEEGGGTSWWDEHLVTEGNLEDGWLAGLLFRGDGDFDERNSWSWEVLLGTKAQVKGPGVETNDEGETEWWLGGLSGSAGLSGEGKITQKEGPFTHEVGGSFFVGGKFDAKAYADKNGAHGHLGGMLGAEAEVSDKIDMGGVSVDQSVGGIVGYAAEAKADVNWGGKDGYGFHVKGKLAYELGLSYSIGVNVNPDAIADAAESGWNATTDFVGDVGGGAKDVVGKVGGFLHIG
ncbi:MAG: hypothetical protein PGN13_11215 [Patulibacter minatonensis]